MNVVDFEVMNGAIKLQCLIFFIIKNKHLIWFTIPLHLLQILHYSKFFGVLGILCCIINSE